MTVIAYAGEQIKGRDGKLLATVARDITSGDLNVTPSQFIMADGSAPQVGAFIPEEIMEFVRGKLSSPSPEPKTEEPASDKPAAKVTAKAKHTKRGA